MPKPIFAAVILALVLGGAVALAEHEHERRDRVIVDKHWTLDKVDKALDELRSIEEKNEGNTSKSSRRGVRDRIDDLRKDLRELRDTVDTAPEARWDHDRDHDDVPPPTPPPTPRGPVSMSPSDFDSLLAAIDRASFANDKLNLVRTASRDGWFTTDQVVSVMGRLTFSNDKVEAAAIMYPHVVDTPNWFRAYGALEFSADRDRLKKRTGN